MKCVDCPKPPGGHTCCPEGLTPICLIHEGETRSFCEDLTSNQTRSTLAFAQAILPRLLPVIGEEYRSELLSNITYGAGMFSFESKDDRVRFTALQVTSESGSPQRAPFA
jgi:hypothetical protein